MLADKGILYYNSPVTGLWCCWSNYTTLRLWTRGSSESGYSSLQQSCAMDCQFIMWPGTVEHTYSVRSPSACVNKKTYTIILQTFDHSTCSPACLTRKHNDNNYKRNSSASHVWQTGVRDGNSGLTLSCRLFRCGLPG